MATEARGEKLAAVELLSINEVADLLGVSRATIRRMIEAGELGALQMGGRSHRPVRVRADEVMSRLQGWTVR